LQAVFGFIDSQLCHLGIGEHPKTCHDLRPNLGRRKVANIDNGYPESTLAKEIEFLNTHTRFNIITG